MMSNITTNKLADNPTKLWDKLKNKQKQKELDIELFTSKMAKEDKSPGYTRFVFISDTHNQTDDLVLPDGDILIHAGDFTKRGRPAEIDSFNEFLGKVKGQYKHVIVIAGNHELTFDPFGAASADRLLPISERNLDHKEMKKKLTNCTFLEDQSVNVIGFNIYGSPWQPEFGGWAYNVKRGEAMLEKWKMIPDDTDILITHGPPLGYGDICSSGLRAGCSELLSTIQQRVKPALHVFGHVHEGYGVWTDGTTTYINASTCTLRYLPPLNPPIVMDLQPPSRQ